MAVVAQGVGNLPRRKTGDVDREGLVHPQRRSGDEARNYTETHDHDQNDDKRPPLPGPSRFTHGASPHRRWPSTVEAAFPPDTSLWLPP